MQEQNTTLKQIKINEQVKVKAYFEDESDGGFVCQPLKMEFRGKEVAFNKFRINYDTAEADKKVFDLFDEERRYRLIFNMENLSWLLSSVGFRNA